VLINTKMLFLEFHNKTFIPALGFFLAVGGWFLWNLLLSALYGHTITYAVRDGFIHGFGHSLLWWAVVLLIVSTTVLFEIAVSATRKIFWPSDAEVWQVLQMDKGVRARLAGAARVGLDADADADADGDADGENDKGREGADVRREGEIQELLDRPRVMHSESSAAVAATPAAASGAGAQRVLFRRRVSTDFAAGGRGAGGAAVPKSRHSVDVAELLSRRG